MMPIVVVFLTATGGTMFGLYFYKKQKARYHYFYDIVALINSIASDVRYRQDKLSAVMQDFVECAKSPLKGHIELYLDTIDTQSVSLPATCLKKDELRRVTRFLLSLGKTDSGTQLLELEGYKTEFEQDLKRAKEVHDRYGIVYLKLGFALGLGIGILFV